MVYYHSKKENGLAAHASVGCKTGMGRSGKSRRASSQRMHGEMAHKSGLMDELAEFEELKATIMPALIEHLKNGKSAGELRKMALAVIQAKQISNAITADKVGDSNAACKDIIDREEGRPIETKKITHRHQDLPDDQLDALILSKMKDVSED